jgi:hypothetical protein
MFSKLYKDGAKNIKEKNYADCKKTDFSAVAKDVDRLFKSAMFMNGMYEDENNKDIIRKCALGGFSEEQLASFVGEFKGDIWAGAQMSDALWAKQSQHAKDILSKWDAEEKQNPKVKPADRVKAVLDEKRKLFEKGGITKKEMLDFTIAGQIHMQMKFPTNAAKFFSLLQSNRERKALLACRSALGLTEEASLRVAMNQAYLRIEKQTSSKEEIFHSMKVELNNTPTFKEEKKRLEEEHKIVSDREVERKKALIEELKEKDKEPMSIEELDERKAIVHAGPRVQPININELKINKNLGLNGRKG